MMKQANNNIQGHPEGNGEAGMDWIGQKCSDPDEGMAANNCGLAF